MKSEEDQRTALLENDQPLINTEHGPVAVHLEQARQQTPWPFTSFLIAGEIVGTGIMGLPYATSQLGWVVGMGAAAVFGIFAWYSGVLLARVRNDLYPSVRSYAEAAALAGGPRFARVTELAILSNWTLLLPYFLMASANALVLAYDLCYYEWAAVLLVVIFVPAQLRTLHALRIPALLSIVAVLVVLLITLVEFAIVGREPGAETRLWPITTNVTLLSQYNHMSSFIFAYQGQSMFFEIMREMRSSRKFPQALLLANIFMALLYSTTSAVAYHYKGTSVSSFLPGSLKPGPARTITALLLTYHVIIAYLLTAQPLVEQLHRRFWAKTAVDFTWRGQRHWAMIHAVLLAFAYIVANIIPFFADFQNIIGSALGAPIAFGWPAAFYLLGMRKAKRAIPLRDKIGCLFFLGVLLPFCTITGVTAAVRALISDWRTIGKPFDCHLKGFN